MYLSNFTSLHMYLFVHIKLPKICYTTYQCVQILNNDKTRKTNNKTPSNVSGMRNSKLQCEILNTRIFSTQ